MTSITTLRQARSLRHIDTDAAWTLMETIHRHLEPEALIEVLWSQAATLCRATGLAYRHAERDLQFSFGDGPHTASYGLSLHGEGLGELVLRFQRRVDDTMLGTAEELLALAMPALRNALTYHEARVRADRADRAERAARASTARVQPLPERRVLRLVPPAPAEPGTASDDALVLVRLDGFDDIRATHGEAWTQTLIETLRSQIDEGLRDADSVFQIDEAVLAVLLPRTSETAALDVAGKIRVLIAGLHLRDGRVSSQLTACMGVVGARAAGQPEEVLARARSALAEARREGASSIRAYQP